ncbi:uncharacterized protein N7496_006705 [Penicillium cataractarum]|uniref:Uncharacterized protein n=1 Tax=Penicillium cataractarum TaxID=2100454 RepID=A0A9W9V6E0_9EURO|nr:uncharacterized protein N7496_006705 [Penicillium cataractarum]KAJ5370613.1 hypothetical protein N7496_006705 [Penicillium cataractarum]
MSDQPSSDETFTIEGVLTDDDIGRLEKAAIIEPIPSESKHSGTCTVTISRLQLNPKFLPPVPFTTADDDIDGGKPYQVSVPLSTESIAVLEFLGFTPASGRELWAGFICQQSTPHPLGLMDYVYEHISLLQTSLFQEMPINKAMILIGLERSIIQTLFDPRYSMVLKSNRSLHAWVKYALADKYARILRYHKDLKGRALWLRIWGDT